MTPDEYTNREFFLDVGDGHELYVQDWGTKDAITPIIFLHGGPGSGCKDKYKGDFDPARHRVIFFDQRGCGRSLPYGSLEHNTTQALVNDISAIADKLELKTFIICGGSWGSTLALAYAVAHPERVEALVIRGIFTGTQEEIDWLNQGAYQTFFPEVWGRFLNDTPKNHRADPTGYHLERLFGDDEIDAKESAYTFACMELGLLYLDDRFTAPAFEEFDPTFIKIEYHYLKNTCFLEENYINENVHKLTMPVYVVQGRYDMVCPPKTAYALHKKLPNSELIWTISGHKNEREGWTATRTILNQITK